MSIEIEPKDEYNKKLLDHVHPEDWQNPEPRNPYNLVVIGAGTAGLVFAAAAAGLGARVALIERALMDGDCLNTGCVPSKGIIRCATAVADVRNAAEYGMRKLRARISQVDSARRFKELGVTFLLEKARLRDRDRSRWRGKNSVSQKRLSPRARALPPPHSPASTRSII